MTKILLIHNIVSPYRVPLFNYLAESNDISIYFCRQTSKDRTWKIDSKLKFNHFIDKGIAIGPLVVAPKLLLHLIRHDYDSYMVTDNDEDILSGVLTVIVAKIRRKKISVWSGQVKCSKACLKLIQRPHLSLVYAIYALYIKCLRRVIYNWAHSVVTYSSVTNKYIAPMLKENTKVFTGTQAMPIELLPPSNSKIPLKANKLQVLYLGYLRPEKGVSHLVEAVLALPRNKVELHIVGNGPEIDTLKAMCANVKNIYFYKYVESVEKANWYTSVDLTVLPTYYDPWGHVVTESLYYGTPVLVTKDAGASSVITNNVNGFIVRSGSTKSIKKILKSLIGDKQLLNTLKANASQLQPELYNVKRCANNISMAANL